MKKVLLVTSKWPLASSSIEGGDLTVTEIIESVGNDCILDMLCFRKEESDTEIPFVNSIKFIDIAVNDKTKFDDRINQMNEYREYIESEQTDNNYDIIIVVHCMYILAMKDNKELLKKTILFPMFMGETYSHFDDCVTTVYIDAEKNVIPYVWKIISPSMTEKKMLTRSYGVDPQKIYVIPRSVNNVPYIKRAKASDKLNIIYIASVRKQKAHMDAVKLVHILNKKGIRATLHCVGETKDKIIYEECLVFAENHKISEQIKFHGTLSREKLMEAMAVCDINISVANRETFGRGIYEGMSNGLPTVILERIKCVEEAENIGIYPLIANDIYEMAEQIRRLYSDSEFYRNESKKGEKTAVKLSTQCIYPVLNREILCETP